VSALSSLASLLLLDQRGLAERFARGRPVQTLAAGRFRGVSLGLPRVIEKLTWKLFAKDVVVVDGAQQGGNGRVHQPPARDAATQLSTPLLERKTFAPFVIGSDDDGAAIIDYRRSSNPFPLSHTIDPLVAVDDDVMLGVSDLHVAGRVQRTPTWFALLR
jgi:hypothetical protein